MLFTTTQRINMTRHFEKMMNLNRHGNQAEVLRENI